MEDKSFKRSLSGLKDDMQKKVNDFKRILNKQQEKHKFEMSQRFENRNAITIKAQSEFIDDDYDHQPHQQN